MSASVMEHESIEEAQKDLGAASDGDEVVVDVIEMEGEAADAIAALCGVLNEHEESICNFIERLVQNAYGCGVIGGHGKYASRINA